MYSSRAQPLSSSECDCRCMSMCGPARKGACAEADDVPTLGWWSSEGGEGVDRAGDSWCWWWCDEGGSWALEYLGAPGEYWGGPPGRPPPAPAPGSCWWCGGKNCWWRWSGSGEVGSRPAALWAANRALAEELLGRPRFRCCPLGEKWRGSVGIFCRYEICVSGVRLMGLRRAERKRMGEKRDLESRLD